MADNGRNGGKKLNTGLVPVITVLVIIAGLLVYMKWMGPFESSDGSGGPAPNFRLSDLEGRYITLEDYKGKVVLVNIWATWCGPCVAEAPSLDKLNSMFNEDDFGLLAVSIDEMGERAVRPFMKKHNLSFPVLVDPGKTIMDLYGATAVPESFVVRRDGIIDRKIIGAIDWTQPEVVEYFRKLIQEE